MRSDGRHQRTSTAAAKHNRSATVPKAPTALKRCFANADPTWTLTMPSRTRTVGEILIAGVVRSCHVLDVLGHVHPRVHALLVYGERGRRKRGIGERADGYGHELR